MSSLVCVDVEADGPHPINYSIISFGAIIVDDKLDKTFYGKIAPIRSTWDEEALAVSGFSRREHLEFDDPFLVMTKFKSWLSENVKEHPIFISDNPAWDFQWINAYFYIFCGDNPFGHSGRRIGDIYSGLTQNMRNSSRWKKFRRTKHTHNALDDCRGNAEVLIEIADMGVKGII